MKLVRRLIILAAGFGAALVSLLVDVPTTKAACWPWTTPAFIAIWCTLDDRQGGATSGHYCRADLVERKGTETDGSYAINGYCKQWQVGQADSIYNFRAKSAYQATSKGTWGNVEVTHGGGKAQESIRFFRDDSLNFPLGTLAAGYSCPQNPFTNLNVPCTRTNLAPTMKTLPPILPLTSGLASCAHGAIAMNVDCSNTGTSQQGLTQTPSEPYIGVWRSGDDLYYLWHVSGWTAFVDKWTELGKLPMRLVDIETFTVGQDRRFVGVWREGKDSHYLWRAAGWKAFTDKWQELAKQNLRLVEVETVLEGNTRHYIGVWRAGQDGYALWQGDSWKAFTDKWQELAKQNLRLIDIETFLEGNTRHYIGVWRAGQDGYALWQGDSWKAFTDKWQELAKQNLRLVAIETFVVGNKRHFIGVWREGRDGYYLWQAKNWSEFTSKWAELGAQNLRLVDIERP